MKELDFRDGGLLPLWEKVRSGVRLTFEEGLLLFETEDLIGLGKMANYVKRTRSGERVYFVVNRHINYTNLCVLSCGFCDFARKKGLPGAYELSTEEVLGLVEPGIREVHIVGGHHPDWPFERYVEMVKAVHQRFPHVQIKAFTAAEIDHISRRWKLPVEEILTRLKEAGLSSMPGGGAEVFSDRVRRLLFPGKAPAERWLHIHRLAHSLGIPSNATLLYGHIETYRERVQHLLMLRELQDETSGFLAFIPLAYQVGETKLVQRQASALEDLKTVAASRLLLDNFPHIKAYWVMVGEATASIALNFGADDMDGTIGQERIAHAAGAESPAGLARERIIRLIKDAGKVPVERDALYHVIRTYS
ncbi:MAG: aminofutalosine synthase MqnE [Chloroflexota bacterium]|nr:aminofutalosine synthase MqnE [Chloroflexota bacterium]